MVVTASCCHGLDGGLSEIPYQGILHDVTEQTYTVTGMTCGHCVRAVTEELEKLDGVQAVDVDLDTGRVKVRSDADLDPTAVAEAVDEAGYALAGP